MKFTIILINNNPEVVWNTFRMANLMLSEDDDVTLFINGPAVNYKDLHSDQFPIMDLAKTFALSEGVFYA